MPKKKAKKKTVKAKSKKPAKAKKTAKKKALAKRADPKTAKKAAPKKKPAPAAKTPVKLQPLARVVYKPAKNEHLLGEVEDYFARIGVIALHLKDAVQLGDGIHVRGHTTDLTFRLESMQIDHKAIDRAKKGDSVGIKVDERCRKGDQVFRVK